MRYGVAWGIAALALNLLAMPLAGHAQSQTARRIGWLIMVPSTSGPTTQAVDGFRQTLRELGQVEGQNLHVEYRYADNDIGRLPALAAELVNLKVDVIVTDGTAATRAAQMATRTIPIVMAFSAAPVEQGLVASLARPGGNITGITMLLPELDSKRIELVKGLVPKATRVAVLRSTLSQAAADQMRATEKAARDLGLELRLIEVQRDDPDYERAFDIASRGKVDALVVLPDPIIARDRARVTALARKYRLPAIYFDRMFVEAGGLMSYGPSIPEMFRYAARYVDKILRGAKPGDLPVEQPTKFELVLNLTAAEALGLTFPPALREWGELIR